MPDFNRLEFANPEFFYLFIIVPLLIAWYVISLRRKYPRLNMSTTDSLQGMKPSLRQRLRYLLPLLRIIALSLIIVVLARPQLSSSRTDHNIEGIDIVLTLDISTSMLAEDFKPNRLEAAKKTAREFVNMRNNDRMGLVIFAGESFTQCPVTVDHQVLKDLFGSVKTGMLEDGTAIGLGLATAVSRLKDSKAKSKVVILLTDGVNNRGEISPQTAAEIAETMGVRVYTIGVGSQGTAPYPFDTPFGRQYRNVKVEIDEDVLKGIAGKTGGKYFRATNNKALESIYKEIDKMEKTKMDDLVFSMKSEEFHLFALAAIALIGLELLLRYTVFRSNP